jgi:hypothetical protein
MIYTTNAVEALLRKYEAEIDVALSDEGKVREEMAAGGSLRAVAKRWGVSRGVVRRLVTKA